MVNGWFGIHEGLGEAGRLPSLSGDARRISATEVALLLLCGAAAAATVGFVKLGLRVPGHAIVLAVLPMALGLSLAPRRLAGTVMSAGAFGTALLLSGAGGAFGSGALTSLCLIGPTMDVALTGARGGWRLYGGLVLAGVAANLAALGSRGAAKLLGLDVGDTRPFDTWWLQAMLTYTLSGTIAGLAGALCWFQFTSRERRKRDAGA